MKYSKYKKFIGIDTYTASVERVKYIFDNFEKIYLSFSGGKDSTVMLHIVMDEAMKRKRKIGLLLIDLEAQYQLTIEHAINNYKIYEDYIEPYWVSIPITLRNSVSQYQTKWIAWEPEKKDIWVRNPPNIAITSQDYFSFYKYPMEFEDFMIEFGKWYGEGKPTACFVGIRSDESLSRFRTISSKKKQTFNNKQWTTKMEENLYNIYPIYDWKTKDIWIYQSKNKNKTYNKLYDRMYQAGLTINQMRICQPYGDDQRQGLWLYHIIEPENWSKIVSRVNGANQGSLYAKEKGNILGINHVSLPPNHTWKSFAELLLESMPKKTSEHFKNKIAVFIKWYEKKGYPDGIPDDGPLDKTQPSWKRVCKALLKNDYWCKSLSFTQHKTGAYEKYMKLMEKRRKEWKII